MTDCKHSWTIYWGESHAECYNCNRRLAVDDIEYIINKYDDVLADRERLRAVVEAARRVGDYFEEWVASRAQTNQDLCCFFCGMGVTEPHRDCEGVELLEALAALPAAQEAKP